MAGTNPQQQGGNAQAQRIFSVTCRNGHVSYFDKQRVCSSNNQTFVRGDGKVLDEIYLKCDTCGDEMIARVDCEGFK